MKKQLILLTALLCTSFASAQLSGLRHYGEGALKVNFTQLFTKCPDHPWGPAKSYSHLAVGWEVERFDMGKGEMRFAISSKLTELACQLITEFYQQKSPFYLISPPDVGSFLNYRMAFNLFVRDRVVIAPGFGINDYYFTQPTLDAEGSRLRHEDFSFYDDMHESSGWYWCSGPSLFYDVSLFDHVSVHGKVAYEIPFLTLSKKDVEPSDNSKLPHFLYFQASLHHDLGFFIQYEMIKANDRGLPDLDVTRNEIKFGYQFKILGR